MSFWWNDFNEFYFDKEGRMEQWSAKKSTKWSIHRLDVFMHDYTFEKVNLITEFSWHYYHIS